MPDTDLHVELTIVQPNVPISGAAIDIWRVRGDELRPYANEIANGVGLALQPDPPLRPGEHCARCDARGACGALASAATAAMEYAYSEVQLPERGAEALGRELFFAERFEKVISAHRDGLQTRLEEALRRGEKSADYRISVATSRLEWTAGYDSVFRLGELAGIDLRKSPEPITPTQAIKKGIDKEIIEQYASRRTSAKLERIDHQQAMEIFAK